MSDRQKRIFWPGLFVSVLVLAALSLVSAGFKSRAASSKDTGLPNVTQIQSAPVFESRIRVWIHGDDIRPNVIHARPGWVQLTAQNETAIDASLVVERVLPGQPNSLVGRIPTLVGNKRATQELVLGVGQYVFYEELRPNIRGTLLVEPE